MPRLIKKKEFKYISVTLGDTAVLQNQTHPSPVSSVEKLFGVNEVLSLLS